MFVLYDIGTRISIHLGCTWLGIRVGYLTVSYSRLLRTTLLSSKGSEAVLAAVAELLEDSE